MKEYKNAFIGLPLPHYLLDEFKNILNILNKIMPELRTVNPNTPHITIYYLGTQLYDTLVDIGDILEYEKHLLQNSTIKFSGFDYFTHTNPKVLYLNVLPNIKLQYFYQKLSTRLYKFNPPDNRLYKPHLTIARISDNKLKNEFNNKVASITEALKNIRWEYSVAEVNLYGRDFTRDDKTQKVLKKVIVDPLVYKIE